MKSLLSSALEVLGLLTVVAGITLFDWRVGLIALGGVLVLIGYALGGQTRSDEVDEWERGKQPRRPG